MSVYLSIGDFKQFRISYVFALFCIASYVIFNLFLGLLMAYPYYLSSPDIRSGSHYYQFLTSLFFHANIKHLAINLLALIVYGIFVEKYFGKGFMILSFFVCGIMGGIMTVLLDPYSYSLGCSGATLGLLGVSLPVLWKRGRRYVYYSLIYVAGIIQYSFQPGIGTWAHIFGLFSGLALSFLRKYYREKKTPLSLY